MSYFKGKMHQIRFRLGLRPKPRWGAWDLRGLLPRGGEGLGREGRGKEGGQGKGAGREGKGSRGGRRMGIAHPLFSA